MDLFNYAFGVLGFWGFGVLGEKSFEFETAGLTISVDIHDFGAFAELINRDKCVRVTIQKRPEAAHIASPSLDIEALSVRK